MNKFLKQVFVAFFSTAKKQKAAGAHGKSQRPKCWLTNMFGYLFYFDEHYFLMAKANASAEKIVVQVIP